MSECSLEQYASVLLDVRKFRWGGALLGGDVAPVRNTRHARWRTRHTHQHRFREVLIGLSGHALYGWKGDIYPIRPGTVFLFDADEEHDAWYPAFDPPCCHLWLHESLTSSNLTLFWNPCEVRNHRFVFTPATPLTVPRVGQFWKNWDALRLRPEDPLGRARFLAAFAALVPDIYGQSLAAPATPDVQELNRQQVIREITQVIKKNPGGDLSLDHLARLAGYSKFHFLRMFHAHQRCSLRSYIHQIKLQRATELLRSGLTATAVAEALGFSSPSSFHRFFHRQTGKRPSECYGDGSAPVEPPAKPSRNPPVR